MLKEHVVTNLKEFNNTIAKIKAGNKEMWYRGHSKASYRLAPTIHRYKKQIRPLNERMQDFKWTKGDSVMPNEWAVLDEFREIYHQMHPGTELEDMQCLYLMQHYGILTRLLDFSRNPLVALYFALSKSPERPPFRSEDEMPLQDYELADYDAAVFCLDPCELNDQCHVYFQQPVEINEKIMEYVKGMYPPLAITTSFKDKRIEAQQGAFVLFGGLTRELDNIDGKDPFLNKIIIPNKHIAEMYQELRDSGITHYSIYPDFTGKAKDMNEDMIDRLNASYKELLGDSDDTNWC